MMEEKRTPKMFILVLYLTVSLFHEVRSAGGEDIIFRGRRKGYTCPVDKYCIDLSVLPKNALYFNYNDFLKQDQNSSENWSKVPLVNGEDSGLQIHAITASTAGCTLNTVEVSTPVLLHHSIGDHCTNLTFIKMEGTGWNCSWDGWTWLQIFHERRGKNYQNVSCSEVAKGCENRAHDFDTGLNYQKICTEGVKSCGKCNCYFKYRTRAYYENPPAFTVTIDCSGLKLTDADIPPKLPKIADIITFENNKLTSTRKLMKQAAEMPYLGYINLIGNQITTLPVLEPTHLSPDLLIYLNNNSISEILGEGMDSYLSSQTKVTVNVIGNPLNCGCDFYRVHLRLRSRKSNWHVMHLFDDFIGMECKDGSLPKLYADESCTDLQNLMVEDKRSTHILLNLVLTVLVILDLTLIYLAVDLQMAIRQLKQGYSSPRVPKIHSIYVTCTSFYNEICGSPKTKVN